MLRSLKEFYRAPSALVESISFLHWALPNAMIFQPFRLKKYSGVRNTNLTEVIRKGIPPRHLYITFLHSSHPNIAISLTPKNTVTYRK